MNLKLKFQLSTPINLDMADQIISLVDIKPHFMTQEFYLSIDALSPTENVRKYDNVSFDLSNENLKKGDCSLDLNEDVALFTIDAEFNIKPRSNYTSLVKNSETKWAFGGIFISKSISSFEHDLILTCNNVKSPLYNAQVVSGGSVEEFSYEKRERTFQSKYHLLNTVVS
tara:strand:+ start:486 stop:995 length:510 start_codon:yes stop_codon:yes gene_type:complete